MSAQPKMSAPYTKLDKPLDEYAMLCRGCLAESGEMKNMYEWGLAEDFYECTNIKVKKSDGLSELLCTQCEELLLTCKEFRDQCFKSDHLLRTTAKERCKNTEPENNEDQKQDNSISCVLYDKKLIIMIVAPDMEAKIYLSCPYCQGSFLKQKDLMLHLVRSHQIKDKEFSIELQYYCSVPTCNFHINSGKNKFFSNRKYLNQHVHKVHTDRLFHCNECTMTFATESQFQSHFKTCNVTYMCQICNLKYNTNEKLLVHLMRKHPDIHKQYKDEKKALKRKSSTVTESKRSKNEQDKQDYICDSPKRSFATQTKAEENIKNDVTLTSWQMKTDNFNTKTDEISTQTVFEDLLSLKSQTSEDESIFFSETVSLSDIQTQTFPLEFGLSRSHKETLTSQTQSPDLSIKETQTCFCLYDSPKINYRLFDSVSSSPCSLNLISSETQTQDLKSTVKSDVLLSFNSTQTQTSFDDGISKERF